MSLYDRKPLNYKGYQNETNNEAFAQSDIALISFVKQTYQLLRALYLRQQWVHTLEFLHWDI